MRSLSEALRQTMPRSLWRERLSTRASPLPVHEYLIDEANLRGFFGAFREQTPQREVDSSLDIEDVVVGLLEPQAPLEGRIFKLVLRILQSGKVSAPKLLLRAKRERADFALCWLLRLVPQPERNEAVGLLNEQIREPRAYRGLDYRYDPQRLIRRPARKDDLWRKPPS
ncbi:MAG: hypothetical protein ACT4TC_17945 [Myxococcaceae bacterium]